MSAVTAVILAGGVGKRFTPFVTDKTLFPFMGKTPLERTLDMVAQAGIRSVILAANQYNYEWIRTVAENHPQLSITVEKQDSPRGMGDALLSLRHLLPERDILIMNAGDMVEYRLLSELLESIENQYAVVTGLEMPEYQPLGYFQLDGDRVVGVVEKPGKENMPSTLANLVFHYFSQPGEFITTLEGVQQGATEESDDVYEQALTEILRSQSVGVYRYSGAWQKLKFGFNVLDLMNFFLNDIRRHISEDAEIAPTATINGEVIIEAGARILDGAVIQGPAYIGPDALVGNQALVRQSMVEAQSVVGFASEVVRSYVGARSDLHHAYVGDSILESGVHFGYNAHTANYRFDHAEVPMRWTNGKTPSGKTKLGALIASGVEVGVNSSIMPGVAIGEESTIFPATVVFEAVPDHSMVRSEAKTEIQTKDE